MLMSDWKANRTKYIKQVMWDMLEYKTCGVYDKELHRFCDNKRYKISNKFCKKHRYIEESLKQTTHFRWYLSVNTDKICEYCGCDRYAHFNSNFCPVHEDTSIRCIYKEEFENFDRISYGIFNQFEKDARYANFKEMDKFNTKLSMLEYQKNVESIYEMGTYKIEGLDNVRENFERIEGEINAIIGCQNNIKTS
jgi:hypothetical protein